MVKEIAVAVWHFNKQGRPKKYYKNPCFAVGLEIDNDLAMFLVQMGEFNRRLQEEARELKEFVKSGGSFKAEFYVDRELIATTTQVTDGGSFCLGDNDAYIFDAESLMRAYGTGGGKW